MKIKIETHAELNSTDQYAFEYLPTNRVFINEKYVSVISKCLNLNNLEIPIVAN